MRDETRHTQILTGPWHFLLDPDDIGEQEMWCSPGYDQSAWRQVHVPGPWDLYDPSMWGCESVGWYATVVPPTWAQPGRVQRLHFGRVGTYAKVWLNGELLGEHLDGYLPFEFDVTNRLRSDAPNTLVLRVDNHRRPHWLPGGPVVEWVQYGGILEPVTLRTLNPVHITRIAIEARPSGEGAEIACALQITNQGFEAFAGRVTLTLDLPTGSPVDMAVHCAAGSEQTVQLTVHAERAAHWSPENPVLYSARAALTDTTHVVDEVNERFGVRSIETRGRQILLNRQPLHIQGVCRYDEVAGYGPTVPMEIVRQDLLAIKRAGANLVRMNYPQSPDILALMDELGLLVLAEAPLDWWAQSFLGGGPGEHDEEIVAAAEQALEGMIERDRNHPAIIAWSVANECGTETEVGIRAMRQLMRRARELDSTRLAFFVAAGTGEGHLAFDEADFVGVNLYPGLFERQHPEAIARHIADMETRVTRPMIDKLKRTRALYPDKPIVVTEFGARSIPGLHGDAPYTEEHHAAYLEAAWRGIREGPEIVGGVLWAWADYYHQRDFVGFTSPMPFGPFGAVTVDRKPKLALQALARMYGGTAGPTS